MGDGGGVHSFTVTSLVRHIISLLCGGADEEQGGERVL